jgi:hypothetical protein
MEALSNRVPDTIHTNTAVTLLELQHQQQVQNGSSGSPLYEDRYHQQQIRENDYTSPVSMSVGSHPSHTQQELALSQQQLYNESPSTVGYDSSVKRKRRDFELNVERSVDVVNKGLISLSNAEVYFKTFFQGCVSLRLWC